MHTGRVPWLSYRVHACSERVRWALVGGEENESTFLPCSPGWPMGAESGREPGLAGLDTTPSPQAPVLLPAAASVFSTPRYAHFHGPSQKLSQGLGQPVGG